MQTLTTLRSDTSKLVVLYLRQVGTATPDELAARLDLRMLTVLATLRHLVDADVVERLSGSERVRLADGTRRAGDGFALDGFDGHADADGRFTA
ncbi:MAG: hypothetical protein ABEJ78_07235 [Haloferacaceae archaeon]